MTKNQLKLWIDENVSDSYVMRVLYRSNPKIYESILFYSSSLNQKATIKERIFYILNDIKSPPICELCKKNETKFDRRKNQYSKFCSHKCATSNKDCVHKRKKTCLEKYGVDNPAKDKNIYHRIEQTNLKRYGVKFASQSKEIRERIEQTNLKRYGTRCSLSSKNVRKKIHQTCLDRYGVKNVFELEEIQKQIKDTIFRKYGVEYITKSKSIREKIKQTNLKKLGCIAPAQNYGVMQKMKHTCFDRYGIEKYNGVNIDASVLKKLNDKKWLIEQHHKKKKTLRKIGKQLGVCRTTVGNRMVKFGIKILRFCFSEQEKEIVDFLKQLDNSIVVHTNIRYLIYPLEIDIYLPEYNIAIEYNGLHWHSEAEGKDRKYHLNKTELCEKKGIRLIHIFSDEWENQRQKCKDTLKHFIKKSEKGTYARNTVIKEISWGQAKEFLNMYHLLGAGTSGNYRIGAFDKTNNLIAVMVFGHKNNEGVDITTELKRFVTDKKNNPGIGSKMFKYAINQKEYNEIIAFVDRRWFTGKVKSFLGFEFVRHTDPSLWWTNGIDRHHRRWKTKSQLIEAGADSTLTKVEMMKQHKFYRIWDCGKILLKWDRQTDK